MTQTARLTRLEATIIGDTSEDKMRTSSSEAREFAVEANSGVDWANHNQFMQIALPRKACLLDLLKNKGYMARSEGYEGIWEGDGQVSALGEMLSDMNL